MAVMMPMNTHLKFVLYFRGDFDLYFLFIVDIWYIVLKGSGYTLISISFQKCTVSPANSNLVDLCPNLWCNNYKETFFLGISFCDFDFSFVLTKNVCFCCALCGNVTAFCYLSLNKTVQNLLWKSQLCPKSINIIMEKNRLHKSGANSTLFNVEINGFPLSSHIFIWTSHIVFAVMKRKSKNSMYLSVSANDPGIKSEISGVIWKVSPESKIQLISCELSPKSLLGISSLEDICAIDLYIFCDSLWSLLLTTSYLFSLIYMH